MIPVPPARTGLAIPLVRFNRSPRAIEGDSASSEEQTETVSIVLHGGEAGQRQVDTDTDTETDVDMDMETETWNGSEMEAEMAAEMEAESAVEVREEMETEIEMEMEMETEAISLASRRRAVITAGIVLTIGPLTGAHTWRYFSETSLNVHVFPEVAPYGHLLIAIFHLVSTCLAGLIVDRVGRVPLLLVSGIWTSMCYTTMACFLEEGEHDSSGLLFVSLLSITFIYALGFGSMPWIIYGELIPTDEQDCTSGTVTFIHWLITISIMNAFPTLISVFGERGVFATLSVLTLMASLIGLHIPETKLKTLEQIQDLLKGGNENNQNLHLARILNEEEQNNINL